jgi:hypothetical protein
MHGAWCWDALTPELTRMGHRVTAPELPCSDPDAGTMRYAEIVAGTIDASATDVIVVGHSLACLAIPIVPTLRTVARLVYLCGTPAQPGMSFVDQVARWPDMLLPAALGARTVEGSTHRRTAEQAVDAFFHDMPSDVALAAVERLRPQAQRPHTEVCPIAALPATPTSYVMAADDRMLNPRWVRRTIPRLLGVVPIEVPGGHSPFLSRPGLLASVFHRLATTPEPQHA